MARILIAEDEEKILELMRDVLEGAGHEVTGAPNGEEALGKLKAQHFDVALLDVMMPKMNGYQLASQAHGLANPPKIVFVTVRDFEMDKNVIKSLGAAAFVSKPFSAKDLLAVVENLLSRPTEE